MTSVTLTQTERVLRALRNAGPIGISQSDFLPPRVVDEGPKITRVGARIKDLRNDGHPIRNAGTREGFAVYVLDVAGTPADRSQAPPLWPSPRAVTPPPTNALLI